MSRTEPERPILRLAGEHDAEAVHAIYEPIVEKTTISFEEQAPDVEEIRRRIATVLSSYPWLVCEEHGEVLGYVYATQHRARAAYRWAVDVSVYIDERARRRRVGRALYTALFEILRMQGYYVAYAGIALPNPASVALHEALGFQPVGVYRGVGYKHGAWHDVGWWHFELQPRRPSPGEPLPLAAVHSDPRWAEAIERGLGLLRPEHT